MEKRLLHIHCQTPQGLEGLRQAAYFCRRIRALLTVYLPLSDKFLVYFENDVVQIDLDGGCLAPVEAARDQVETLASQAGAKLDFFVPRHFTSASLPDIPADFDFMCSPPPTGRRGRQTARGRTGHQIQRILRAARYPLLVPGAFHTPWQRILVLFGGSANAVAACRLGLSLARQARVPLEMLTQAEGGTRDEYREKWKAAGLAGALEDGLQQWHFSHARRFEESLGAVPADALVVMGAFDHISIREFFHGSKLKTVCAVLPNSLILAGPRGATEI